MPVAGSATEPRRTDRLTPLARALQVIPMLVGLGLAVVVAGGDPDIVSLLPFALGAGVLMIGLVIALSYLAWKRLTFWFDADGDLRVASGIVTRRERRLQLSRLQGVDVSQPLIPRLLGLAEVKVEVAGTGESRISLTYLPLSEANELRNDVIARSAGVSSGAGEAPQTDLVEVPTGELVWSLLLRGSTAGLLLATVLLVILTVLTTGVGGLLALVTGGIPLLMVVGEFTRFYRFRVAESPDGLRIRSGLFQLRSQTIPPGRVQAVEFVQSWLWRPKGWVRVKLNIAGLQSGAEDSSSSQPDTVLLPVAPFGVALAVVERILPGVDVRSVDLHRAPPRARWRSWIQFSRLGVGWSDKVFVTERGLLVSRLAVVPHARTQSVRVTQGPWQRRLGLASMHVDSPPGPVTIAALQRDAGEARQLAEEQGLRALRSALSESTTHWMAPPAGGAGAAEPEESAGSAD